MSREAMQKALDALERYEYAEARVILRAALSEPVQPIGPLAGCVAVWCEEASEDVADWGSYAHEYFQKKHRLQEDIDKWKKRAEQCYNAAPPDGYVMVPAERVQKWHRVAMQTVRDVHDEWTREMLDEMYSAAKKGGE